jgi:type II secretory pathway component GspD/PulD (secretin)
MFPKALSTFLLVLTVSSFPLLSQEAPPPAALPEIALESLSQKVDIEFPGGTLADLLKHIRCANRVTPNVIVSSDAAQLELPAICLRSVTLADFFESLQQFQTTGNYVIMIRQKSEHVMTISANFAGPLPPKATRMSRAYDVKALLDDFEIDDIVTAIETSWKMESAEERTELKYHKETNLLLAMGDNRDLSTVDNILRELQKAQMQTRQAELKATRAQAEVILGNEVAKLQKLVEHLKTECARLNKRIVKLEATLK